MSTVTMEEILKKNQMDPALLFNPRFTKALAAKLKARGFRTVNVTIDGKQVRAWTDEEVPQYELDKILDVGLAND